MAAYMNASVRHLSDYSFVGREKRVEALRPVRGESLSAAAIKRLKFGEFYFPRYVTFPYADFHPQVMQNFQIRGRLVVIVLPRNAGKGTMAFIDNMYDIAYATETYIIRIEHDGRAAKDESFKISHEWTTNFQLMRDFEVGPGPTWRPGFGELRFSNGVRFQALGLKELVRGRTELHSRISKVQVNDPVKNAQEARSAVHTQDVYDLVMRSVAKAGGSLQEESISYCVLGTCQARGDALDRLVRSPMAKVHKIPALIGEQQVIADLMDCLSSHAIEMRQYCDDIEQTTGNVTFEDREQYFQDRWNDFAPFFALESYWADRFPVVDLFFDAAGDTGGFAQEMLHLTEDVKYIKFQDAWFLPYNGQIPDGPVTYAMTIDPSGEPKEGTDPMAIYAGGYHHKLKEAFTQHVWCDQGTPNDLVEKTYEIFWKCYPWYRQKRRGVAVYMEDSIGSSGSGYALFETTRKLKIAEGGDPEYWMRLPLQLLDPGKLGNKLAGISALRPHFEQGRMHYIPAHSHQELMKTQFLNYNGKHTHQFLPPEFKIDICDTVRMWWAVATKAKDIKPVFLYGDGKK